MLLLPLALAHPATPEGTTLRNASIFIDMSVCFSKPLF